MDEKGPKSATELVDELIALAKSSGASDVHIQPTEKGLEIRTRIDGVLQPASLLPKSSAPSVVARLKVLADLLTYRSDVPQEGRIKGGAGEPEIRLSTFPTLLGEKAVLRFFGDSGRYQGIADLGLGPDVEGILGRLLGETSGAIILAGPAGSGKDDDPLCLPAGDRRGGPREAGAWRALRIRSRWPWRGSRSRRSTRTSASDLANGLRSLLRQDPEVIAVGEIRDKATAEVALQAALTGHLVLTTFHAGSAAGAAGRLADMEIEPYVLRSGVLAIVCQRLLREVCGCGIDGEDDGGRLGLLLGRYKVAVGCPECRGTGYRGRIVLAEVLLPAVGAVGQAILDRREVGWIEAEAVGSGMVTLRARARAAGESGRTTPAEIRRVFGLGPV